MIIQGRNIYPQTIIAIGRMIANHPDWHRTRLSKELCKRWRWRTDNGQLKDMACRSMLRKLEQKGLIELPAPLHKGNRKRHIPDISHSCEPIETNLHDIQPVKLLPINRRGVVDNLFHCLMDRYHYLGCKGHVGEHMKYYAVDSQERPLACLLFGSAAWKTAPRDQFIGWDRTVRKQNLRLITNNTRFLILPWIRVLHLANFILGSCLRRLQQDWIQKYGHEIFMVETFVDSTRFAGTCYRAANWISVGYSKGRSRQDRHNRLNVSIKEIYVYPLTVDYKERLCAQN